METPPTILSRLLEPVTESISVEMAHRLLEARVDPAAESRLAILRSESNEGELSAAERAEYQSYVQAINLVGILQAKARQIVSGV